MHSYHFFLLSFSCPTLALHNIVALRFASLFSKPFSLQRVARGSRLDHGVGSFLRLDLARISHLSHHSLCGLCEDPASSEAKRPPCILLALLPFEKGKDFAGFPPPKVASHSPCDPKLFRPCRDMLDPRKTHPNPLQPPPTPSFPNQAILSHRSQERGITLA